MRALLALAAVAGNQAEYLDTDGDKVVVRLVGAGTLLVDESGPGAGVGVEGSTTSSRLSISVSKRGAGDGRLLMEGGLQSAALKSLSASAVDFRVLGVALHGACGEVKIGDLQLGADLTIDGGVQGNIKFQARIVDGGLLGQADLNFGSMSVLLLQASVLGRGSLSAVTIKTLKVVKSNGSEGSVRGFDATISGSDEVVEDLGTLSIAGHATDSNWFVQGSVGSVTIASTDGLIFNGSGVLRTMRVRGDAFGGLNFDHIGSLVVDGQLSGNVAASEVDGEGVSIGSIRAATTSILRITTALAPSRGEPGRGDTTFFPRVGAIKSLRLAEGGGGNDRVMISAGRIGTFTVTGKSSAALAGDLRVSLLLSENGETIGKMNVKGVLTGDVVTLGSVNEIKTAGLVNLQMCVGAAVSTLGELDDLFDDGLFLQDLRGEQLPATSTINRLIVSKPPASRGFSTINPNLADVGLFAGRINTLDIFTGFADDTSAQPMGIETTFIGALKIRREGSTLSKTNVSASVLQGLGGAPTLLPIEVGTFAVDASLGPTTAVNDMLLRVFFL